MNFKNQLNSTIILVLFDLPQCWNNGMMERWNVGFNKRMLSIFML